MTYPKKEPDLDEFGYLVDDLPQSDYMDVTTDHHFLKTPNEEDAIKLGGFSDAWSGYAIWYVENP